jgi:hypothetical protein
MGAIEDIMYEVYNKGLNEEMIKELDKLRFEDRYKYKPLSKVYEDAFNNVIIKKNEKKENM